MRTSHLLPATAMACLLLSAGAAHAQQVLSAGNLTATNTTQGLLLGTSAAQADTYLVVANWSQISGNPYSNEARFALNANVAGTGTTYRGTGAFANGILNSSTSTTIWSYGTLSNPITAGGSVALRYSQTFSGSSATWANTRVVLNPAVNDTTTRSGLTAPTSYTDLGVIAIGATNRTITVSNTATGAAGRNWYRFTVSGNVSNALGNALDFFTTGATDTGLVLFRQTASGLVPVADGDDIGGFENRNSGISLGSADPASNGRDSYAQPGDPLYFQGQGADRNAPTGFTSGFFTGTPGAANLDASQTYWLGLSAYNPYLSSTLIGGGTTLGADGISINTSGNHELTWGDPTAALGDLTLEIRSIPTPGTFVTIALAGFVASRRRRTAGKV